MGILDEAIREHLELKRQHGADDSELKQLEDEAFGAPGRSGEEELEDPLAEAPTEFIARPEFEVERRSPENDAEESSSRRELTDIQEPPHAPPDDEPAEEESPAAEHETVPEPEPEPGSSAGSHTTAERHAIADQPTEYFDVEEELGPPKVEDEEETPEAEIDDDEEVEDDFFDEQRLSDELDQALESPLETDEPESDELEPESDSEEGDELEPDSEEAEKPVAPPRDDEDVLEETPDFLEESPDDDQLWFEQKPPKDFDFDD